VNGPQHFANAESDLEHAAHASDKGRTDDVTYWLGCAQVHATLALTAATIGRGSLSMTLAGRHEWQKAIDPEYAAEQTAEVAR
jgi:hypothetical protein